MSDPEAAYIDRGWRYYSLALAAAISGFALVWIAPPPPHGLVLVLVGVVLTFAGCVAVMISGINSREMDEFRDAVEDLRDTINSEGDDG